MKLARLDDGPEIFYSVQGEGASAGQPSVFVRCSLCNLSCQWCDTDYTWNWQGTPFRHQRDDQPGYQKYDRAEQIVELDPAAVATRVAEFENCRNVVLTGGEPMLQQDDLAELMRLLRDRDADYRFEVETNGSLLPREPFATRIDQYNVSPKLANSGVERRARENREAMAFFVEAGAWFKFVVDTQDDLAEVDELVNLHRIPPDRVYLMPQGVTSEALRGRSAWLTGICLQRGFRFSDRLQIHVYGDRRGT